MATISLKNTQATAIRVVVVPDAEKGDQREIVLAPAEVMVIDKVVASYSPDLYVKIAENKLIITANGPMPAQLYTPANTVVENEEMTALMVIVDALTARVLALENAS